MFSYAYDSYNAMDEPLYNPCLQDYHSMELSDYDDQLREATPSVPDKLDELDHKWYLLTERHNLKTLNKYFMEIFKDAIVSFQEGGLIDYYVKAMIKDDLLDIAVEEFSDAVSELLDLVDFTTQTPVVSFDMNRSLLQALYKLSKLLRGSPTHFVDDSRIRTYKELEKVGILRYVCKDFDKHRDQLQK